MDDVPFVTYWVKLIDLILKTCFPQKKNLNFHFTSFIFLNFFKQNEYIINLTHKVKRRLFESKC